MKILKWMVATLVLLTLLSALSAYLFLSASLPTLNDNISTAHISAKASLSRDSLGTAIVKASNEYDAAYLLAYAHAQDRLFQLDLLRRQSSGELSELVGSVAIDVDKQHRFHQLRKNAELIFKGLPSHQIKLLESYTNGINALASEMTVKPFEYYLLGADFRPWEPVDSLMVVYSMYLDLQKNQTEIDFTLNVLKELYSTSMYEFFTLPSNYQAAIDSSVETKTVVNIPLLPKKAPTNTQTSVHNFKPSHDYSSVLEQPDYGSNNWAVAGSLSESSSGLLSNDMHLGLRVPAIWYRTQLNYTQNGQAIQITGVSLPGTPAVIVGANKHIAWGFTNANIDNADWIELEPNTPTTTINEVIKVANSEDVIFALETSKYGPVRHFNNKRFALKWVAHQNYALNINIADMGKMQSVEQALALSKTVRIPVQNMVVVDAKGDVAWQLTGAITARTPLTRHAITQGQYSDLWDNAETQPANLIKPDNGRVWSANARVIGTTDLARFGNGGYALGARQQQIMLQLMQHDSFNEQSFYEIQLDNRALFLMPWHELLLNTLQQSPQKYANDIISLQNWQACACADSVGYTLVRRFRSTLINQLIEPISKNFAAYQLSSSHLLRAIEPSIWEIIQQAPESWLPNAFDNYNSFYLSAYEATKQQLFERYDASNEDMSNLAWGKVNALKVSHPFSKQLGPLADYFDMQVVEGFGDSYLPAVQAGSFGASQRLIVRPGNLDQAILTIPGGQSGHVLSRFYRTGFSDYSEQKNTPLLPTKALHTLYFSPHN